MGGCFVGVCDSLVKPASTRFDALEEDADTGSQTTRSGSWPSTGSGGGIERKETSDDIEIILGSIDEKSGWRRSRYDNSWYRNEEADAARTVRLSDIRNLPRGQEGELLSYGSIAHSQPGETCKVCVFNRKNGSICRNAWSCTFCHAWHQPYVRPRRPDKRRAKPGGNSVEDVDGIVFGEPQPQILGDPGPPRMPPLEAARSGAPSMVEPWYVQPGGVSAGLSLSTIVPPKTTGSMSSGSSRGFH